MSGLIFFLIIIFLIPLGYIQNTNHEVPEDSSLNLPEIYFISIGNHTVSSSISD